MGKSVSIDQSHSVIQALVNNVDWDALDGDVLQVGIIRNQKEAGRHFTEFLRMGGRVLFSSNHYAKEREDWQKFYKTYFNWDVDFSRVIIPKKPKGNYRLLFIAQGLKLNLVYEKMSAVFPCWRYKDGLDDSEDKHTRNTQNAYAIWVVDGVEPDEEHLGKITREVDPNMEICITLLERMIFEFKYFQENGNHLDEKGVTLCSGSRYSDGGVPGAYWDGDKFEVGWYSLGYSDSRSGIRSVVTL